MIRITLHIQSSCLLRPVEVHVALPHGLLAGEPPYPVLWCLHCAMADGSMFFGPDGLADFVDERGVAIIAPSLGNGFFTDSPVERQAEFLDQELLPALQRSFALSHRREDNYLLGVSMGGFGAVRWALAAPEIFCATASVSGVFDPLLPIDERAIKNREQRPLALLFSRDLLPKLALDEAGAVRPVSDIPSLLDAAAAGHPPKLGLFCGTEDWLALAQNDTMEVRCKEAGVPVTLVKSPGGHNRAYWNDAVPCAVEWLLSQ